LVRGLHVNLKDLETLVADIYALTQRSGNIQGLLRSDYYPIVTPVEVVNGTNYLPILSYVYWNGEKSGYDYWALQVSGVQQPNIQNWDSTYGYFSYLTYPAGNYRENSTDITPSLVLKRRRLQGTTRGSSSPSGVACPGKQ